METPASLIESLFEKSEAYAKTTFELARLKAVQAGAATTTSLISALSVAVALAFFMLALNTGIALLLGELLGKMYYGFFIVAAFYLLAGGVLHFFLRNWISNSVSKSIITLAFKTKDKYAGNKYNHTTASHH